ncbi:MAG: DNA-binding response regulator [Rhodothermaceae bacterium]|nr:MAG: DNA-binding response regulator [Rhodothermaceae bacterium]
MKHLEPLKLCLVCDDELVRAVVRLNCPSPHEVVTLSLAGLLDEQQRLSGHGQAVVAAAREADVVLVDWHLASAPVINTLCYQVRKEVRAPVLALCRNGPDERVAAIAAGADDAVTLPLHLPLLQAKVLSYRRLVEAVRAAAPVPGDARLPAARTFGPFRLDRRAHRFFIRGQEVDLTPREFALLEYLIANAGTLCTREQILDHVWGLSFDTGTNMVEVYMYFLRRKLEAFQLSDVIQTVRGLGYRLVLPEETSPS